MSSNKNKYTDDQSILDEATKAYNLGLDASCYVGQLIDLVNRLKEEYKLNSCDTYRTSWKAKFLDKVNENELLQKEISRLHGELAKVPDPFPCKVGSGCESAGEGCYTCQNNRYLDRALTSIMSTLVSVDSQLDPSKSGIMYHLLKSFCKKYNLEMDV